MSASLPKRLEVSSLAGRDASHDTGFAVSACDRLVQLLADDSGEVVARFGLHVDGSGRCIIEGEVSAGVMMTCQRCLEPVAVALHAGFRLAMVADEDAADALPDGLEPVVSADGTIDPIVMLEDELMLALPVVARHEDGVPCKAIALHASPDLEEGKHPFSVLGKLKKDQES